MADYKKYKRDAEAIENRFNRNKGDAAETYKAMEEYRENIKTQEQELEKMDPNSREYDKAQRSLDQQRSVYGDMEKNYQKDFHTTDPIRQGQKDLANQNELYSQEMDRAVQKGDVKRYEEYRSKYEANIKAQENMEKDVIKRQEDNSKMSMDIQSQRQYMFGKDCQMRESSDPAVSQKYHDQVEQDKKDMLNSQHDRKMAKLEANGASAEEKARENKNHEETMNNIHRY